MLNEKQVNLHLAGVVRWCRLTDSFAFSVNRGKGGLPIPLSCAFLRGLSVSVHEARVSFPAVAPGLRQRNVLTERRTEGLGRDEPG